jgi:hypothetical protein
MLRASAKETIETWPHLSPDRTTSLQQPHRPLHNDRPHRKHHSTVRMVRNAG